jgi:hypothetical protein
MVSRLQMWQTAVNRKKSQESKLKWQDYIQQLPWVHLPLDGPSAPAF